MDGPQFLQALLDLRGLNPNSMAKKAGNHALQSTVARFLGGNQSRRSTMQPVADFFGVDVGGFYDPDKAAMELRRLGARTGEGPMLPGAGETALTIRAPGLTPAPTLSQALEVVAAALQHADELTLIQVRPLLQRLAEQPQQASQIAPRLLALLDGNPLSTETHDFIKQKQTAE